MAYSNNQDIIDLIGTTLDTAIIDRLIIKSDRKINRMLSAQGIGTPVSPSPDELEEASENFSAGMVLQRHRVDGTLPEEYTIDGKMRGKINVSKAISDYTAQGTAAVESYISTQSTANDFGPFHVVGRDGERVGKYETMEDYEEDET